MIYSTLYIQKKENVIPLLFLLIIGIGLMTFIIKGQSKSNFSPITKKTLERFELVNLTPNQAGIYWETNGKEVGWVDFAGQTIFDERDTEASQQQYVHHYVLLKNLQPSKTYELRIRNKEGAYIVSKSQYIQITTPANDLTRSNAKPAYGKVSFPNEKPAPNIFVILKIENNYPLLALSKETGEWLISLNIVVDKTKGNIIPDILDGTRVEIEYIDESNRSTNVVASISNLTPMAKTIVLGSNYNLLAQGDVLGVQAVHNAPNTVSLSVIYPLENGVIPAGKPLIKGTGIPGNDVFVFINSKPQYAFRTKVDAKGEWRVLPTNSIVPGSYTAAITSSDVKGGQTTINRNFIIAKSGEQVLGEATGPATTITPTTIMSSPTVSILLPTSTPPVYATPYPTIQPTSPPPTTGGDVSYLLVAGISFIIMGVGFILVF